MTEPSDGLFDVDETVQVRRVVALPVQSQTVAGGEGHGCPQVRFAPHQGSHHLQSLEGRVHIQNEIVINHEASAETCLTYPLQKQETSQPVAKQLVEQ